MTTLAASFAQCRTITAGANSSFPLAFRLLARPQRRAMDALYAFLRVSDDLADAPSDPRTKRAALQAWRIGLCEALEGRFTHPVHPALVDTVRRFSIPPRLLLDVLDGVASDLEPVRFNSFAELYPYCYRVASAVGLACIRVWGLRAGAAFDEADPPAEAAGIAFQLTNILRDLGEDLAAGRVYLPLDELAECPSESWRDAAAAPKFAAMIREQAARARDYYRRSEPLDALLSPAGRGVFRVMSGTYRGLLEEIARSGAKVLERRVRVPRWRKGLILLGGWTARYGLT
jgi:15-cis-phytoene synthase